MFFTRAKLKVNTTFPVVKVFSLFKIIKNAKDESITIETRDKIYELLLKAWQSNKNRIGRKLESKARRILNIYLKISNLGLH